MRGNNEEVRASGYRAKHQSTLSQHLLTHCFGFSRPRLSKCQFVGTMGLRTPVDVNLPWRRQPTHHNRGIERPVHHQQALLCHKNVTFLIEIRRLLCRIEILTNSLAKINRKFLNVSLVALLKGILKILSFGILKCTDVDHNSLNSTRYSATVLLGVLR